MRFSPRITVLATLVALVALLVPAPAARAGVIDAGLRVLVPAVGIDLPIVPADASLSVGWMVADHYPGTAWPGQGERSVLYAHDQPGMFAALSNVLAGQEVQITRTDGIVLRYTVTANNGSWATGNNSILNPIGHEQLVLITCTSWSSTDPKRVVIAEPVTHDHPGAPYATSAEISGAGTATVHWAQPTLAGYTPIQGYNITSNPYGSGLYVSVNAPATSATIPGIQGGVTYNFWVQTYSAMGVSYWSAATNGVVAYPPNAPVGITAVAGDGAASISWSPPSSTGGATISQYTVVASPGGQTARVGGLLNQAWVWGLSNGTSYTFTVTASNWTGWSPPSAASNSVTPVAAARAPGRFHPLAPARILDTRPPYYYNQSALGENTTINIPVVNAYQDGVPANALAVVMNVTVQGPTAPGYLTIWPAGQNRPNASNVNFVPGQTVPNLVEVGLGTNGMVSVYNYAGVTNVIIDVSGWVSDPSMAGTDGLFNTLDPAITSCTPQNQASPLRLLDTRTSNTPMVTGQVRDVAIVGLCGVPAGAAAVALNVTAVDPTDPGYVTVFPSGQITMQDGHPPTSNLNFMPHDIVPNRVIVKIGNGGAIGLYNRAGYVHIVIDVVGWYTDGINRTTGSAFNSLVPTRILDTRPMSMINRYPPGGMTAGSTIKLNVAGIGGIPAMTSTTPPKAIVMNATVTLTSAPSYLSFMPSYNPASGRPATSDLNWGPGDTRPNLVIAWVAPDGTITIYNNDGGADVILDVAGWYG